MINLFVESCLYGIKQEEMKESRGRHDSDGSNNFYSFNIVLLSIHFQKTEKGRFKFISTLVARACTMFFQSRKEGAKTGQICWMFKNSH
jgi:hypothetical protein